MINFGEHKEYNLFQSETDGRFEAYRTTLSKAYSIDLKTGEEKRMGTAMDRIVLRSTTYDEACAELDERTKRKPKVYPKHDSGQTSIFDAIKEAQKDNLIDMMKDDQKDGLYE